MSVLLYQWTEQEPTSTLQPPVKYRPGWFLTRLFYLSSHYFHPDPLLFNEQFYWWNQLERCVTAKWIEKAPQNVGTFKICTFQTTPSRKGKKKIFHLSGASLPSLHLALFTASTQARNSTCSGAHRLVQQWCMAVICGQVETGKADMWGNQTTVYGGGAGEVGGGDRPRAWLRQICICKIHHCRK